MGLLNSHFHIGPSSSSKPAKETTTYAVLDDQYTDVFISDALLEQLEVDASEVDWQVNTIGSNSIRTKKMIGLSIQDLKGICNNQSPVWLLTRVHPHFTRGYWHTLYSQSMETSMSHC